MGATYLGSIPNAHIRDYQRQKVYDAEEQCMFWHTNPEISQTEVIHLIQSISTWADIKQPTLYTGNKRTIPRHIRKRLAKYIAYATPNYIAIPSSVVKRTPFVCHEMAHVINYQKGPADHHGPNFTNTYLQLVGKFIGINEEQELRQSFDKKKVNYFRVKTSE